MSSISLIQPDRDLFSWPQYWAACFGPAPFLPMSREEMDQLGWDSCDIILVTGDAYVDHPSFGMAIRKFYNSRHQLVVTQLKKK